MGGLESIVRKVHVMLGRLGCVHIKSHAVLMIRRNRLLRIGSN